MKNKKTLSKVGSVPHIANHNHSDENKSDFIIGMPSRNITPNNFINEFNKYYTSIITGGKNLVVRANLDAFGNSSIEFFNHKEFIDAHKDYNKIQTEIETKNGVSIKHFNPAKLWLESGLSNSSKFGITFYPKLVKFYRKKLNTYMGLGCIPLEISDEGKLNLKLYIDHINNVICSGNEEYSHYLINWIAHAVQKPEEKPEVGILLKAGQGTGKGTLLKPLSKIFGAHYLHATNSEQVIGKFNSQLENKIMIFADEFFAGSKGSTDKLKSMITESTGSIERKGIDRINLPDFSRIIMATNHENVINIERDERRYFYLEISEKYKQNRDYFKPLHKAVKNKDFPGQLLTFLLNINISEFEPRNVPKTRALEEQKIDNLDPIDKWIFEMLQDGSMFGSTSMEVSISKKDTQSRAKIWIDAHGLKVYGSLERQLGKRLKLIGVKDYQPKINGIRVRTYNFPILKKIRDNFDKYMSFETEW